MILDGPASKRRLTPPCCVGVGVGVDACVTAASSLLQKPRKSKINIHTTGESICLHTTTHSTSKPLRARLLWSPLGWTWNITWDEKSECMSFPSSSVMQYVINLSDERAQGELLFYHVDNLNSLLIVASCWRERWRILSWMLNKSTNICVIDRGSWNFRDSIMISLNSIQQSLNIIFINIPL